MSEKVEKHYTNGEITIVWKPDVCIHSKKCWKGLLEVFDPRNRPWVNPFGASSEQIIDQINECPSGALSFYKNEEVSHEQTQKDTKKGDDNLPESAESRKI